ncbi:MAG: hypothetical protein MJZ67_05715 [Bacteroidales bacterium]|nr:hypothetical protein [Bacteroidales bacterium]
MIEIILAIISLLTSCGWLVSGKKYRQEVRAAQAEAEQKEFDVSKEYVKEFRENIAKPLQEEVQKLRSAIEAVNTCSHRAECPVVDKLHEGAQSRKL